MQNMPNSSAVIIPSWPQLTRSGGIYFPYRQNSDLIYFSGFEEPHSCLVLLKEANKQHTHILFVQDKDKKEELWSGSVFGPEAASEIFQMDICYLYNQFPTIASSILKNIESLYYSFGLNPEMDVQINSIIQKFSSNKESRIPLSIHDSTLLTEPLRIKKSNEEIEMIKKSISLSAEAHKEVMKNTRPLTNEWEMYTLFISEIMKRGATREAYTGIFASGQNACTLHYIKNNRVMQDGELFLVDAGGEYNHYSSDITRTFPVNGKFSKDQKRIYTKLLSAQKKLINLLKPGIFFQDIQKKAILLLSEIMQEEGLLSLSSKNIIEKKEYKKYFPHFIGHPLGLDAHDSFLFKTKNFPLSENCVLTIEPGLYLPASDLTLRPELRGMGIRIEDDILITSKEPVVLSRSVPKEIEEIEEIVGSKKH